MPELQSPGELSHMMKRSDARTGYGEPRTPSMCFFGGPDRGEAALRGGSSYQIPGGHPKSPTRGHPNFPHLG